MPLICKSFRGVPAGPPSISLIPNQTCQCCQTNLGTFSPHRILCTSRMSTPVDTLNPNETTPARRGRSPLAIFVGLGLLAIVFFYVGRELIKNFRHTPWRA